MGMEWTDLAEARDNWRVVNMAMKLRIPKNVGNFMSR
jgi:hypothetical protein